jgi:drug/metabolite transporter (DMT)-like permease
MKTFLGICVIAAIWGASHVWVRLSAPVFGAGPVAWARLAIGAGVMMLWVRFVGHTLPSSIPLRTRFLHWGVVGALNGALPFLLFAHASVRLPASYLSILNSLTPAFSALFSWLLLSEPLGFRTGLGLFTGFIGVVLIEEFGPVGFEDPGVRMALMEGVGAAICYGLVGIYIKKRVPPTDPKVLVAGSFGTASVLMLPVLVSGPVPDPALLASDSGRIALVSVILLGVLSSSLAFVMYYALLARVGPFRSSLVTQMIPVFGVLWGVFFLGERLTGVMLLGAGMVLVSTLMILMQGPRRIRS